jgi:hypothetical protein
VGYDYELIFALGSFLGIASPREALEKELVSLEDTLVPLKFANCKEYGAASVSQVMIAQDTDS